MAVRDAWGNKWRSLLMLVMVALPVAAVTALDVTVQTVQLSAADRLPGAVGAADARLEVVGQRMIQAGADPGSWAGGGGRNFKQPTAATIRAELGRNAEVVPLVLTSAVVETARGKMTAHLTATDWASPLTAGTYRLLSGRLPSDAGEVAVNRALADRLPGTGGTLSSRGRTQQVVGVVEDAFARSNPMAFVSLSALGRQSLPTGFLVTAEGGIDWADTLRLNAAGMSVLSKELIANPPSRSELEARDLGWAQDGQEAMLAVIALVVVMALIEVVLLAGPSFAVSARRMQRSLALMAVSGATPRQARRAVMATAWVLGIAAAVMGLLVGLGVAWMVTVLGQPHYSQWFQSLDIPVSHLLLIAGFGVLSALLAAVVPAWLASRQDPVSVLAGRRADGPVRLRSPLLGTVLVTLGIGLAVMGARQRADGEFLIALSAVVTVLGAVLLIPLLLTWLGRLGRRLPLSLRYSLRDATRHRSRTVPAVAAVAATVAGAVALSVALSSDALENRETYLASYPAGAGVVHGYDLSGAEWTQTGEVLNDLVPDATLTRIVGVPEDYSVGLTAIPEPSTFDSWGYGGWGLSMIVADQLPDYLSGIESNDRARADQILADGGAVQLAGQSAPVESIKLRWRPKGDAKRAVTVPGAVVGMTPGQAPAAGVISTAVARELGVPVRATAWFVSGSEITEAGQSAINERLAGIDRSLSMAVERGYQSDAATKIVLWALIGVAALLMLGGTLTSTFLSLADARGDLTTLAAVGAAPRTRRRVAAGYALVIGGLGAVLGTLIGLIPGIAVSFPLTNRGGYGFDTAGSSHYLDIPWLTIAMLVLALPLLTAVSVALFTRSRLPLLARSD